MFIPNGDIRVGDCLYLARDYKVPTGTFTHNHLFWVRSIDQETGLLNLEDSDNMWLVRVDYRHFVKDPL